MKGLFVFESKNTADEFPLEVTARFVDGNVKGKVFFKSEQAAKQECEMIDKQSSYKIAGESGKLSELLYVPYVFFKDGSDFSSRVPPLNLQTEYEGETVWLYAIGATHGTAKSEGGGCEYSVHIVPFSSEELESEYYERMVDADNNTRREVWKWPVAFLAGEGGTDNG